MRGQYVKLPDFNDKIVKLPECSAVNKWNCQIYVRSVSEIARFLQQNNEIARILSGKKLDLPDLCTVSK